MNKRDLLDAVNRGHLFGVQSLLDGGADPGTTANDGLTALILASQKGYPSAHN